MKINNILKAIKQLNTNYNVNNTKLYKSLIDEIEKNLLSQEEDLILRICNHYNLNIYEVKKKFLRKQKKKQLNISFENLEVENKEAETKINNSSPILYKFDLNNTNYYIECVENGNVYDINKNIVGIFKNNNIILNI
jgi:hypothetical protein